MDKSQVLNINPVFKQLFDKCNIDLNRLDKKFNEKPSPTPSQTQKTPIFSDFKRSSPINFSASKSQIQRDSNHIWFKPEVLVSIKETISTAFTPYPKIENFDEAESSNEYIVRNKTKEEKIRRPKLRFKETYQDNDDMLKEMKNTESYKELINYRSGDLKKKKFYIQGFEDQSISNLEPKTMPATNLAFSDYCSLQVSKESVIKYRKLPQRTEISHKSKKTKKYHREASLPIHKIFHSLGLNKLSKALQKDTRSTSEIRYNFLPRNNKSLYDVNKSYDYIIDNCTKESNLNKSLLKEFKQDSEFLLRKFRKMNQEDLSEKIKLKSSEKEELEKYKVKLNEMTKTQMLAFKTINQRRQSKCISGDKLLEHL
ncbi:unnamed protein product [Blepharisma stoltei]|uniref:Uncharacterized protein n=1 Tax=Blepharisma stoltei TaxID=1481888 RepID=A0AAU9IQM8_9CILI|nr:unnamed protein product [Blepharisma stoltei]